MASEEKPLSEFPRALQVAEQALVMISNPDGLGGYDTNGALLTEVGRAILAVQYTQQLGNVSVFDAIKNTRVLSGTTTPTANEGANGQLYVKYETVSNVDSVVGMYFKKDGAWLEISLGGGGGSSYVELTQAEYDAMEQAGTLDPDTLYFITDGNIGNDIIDDSTASETTVYSSDKVEDLLSDKQDKTDNNLTTTNKTVVGAINELNTVSTLTATWNTTYINAGSLTAYKCGKIVFITAFFRSTNGFNANTIFGSISGINLKDVIYESAYGSGGQSIRLKVNTNGTLENESAVQANSWFSFSAVGIET